MTTHPEYVLDVNWNFAKRKNRKDIRSPGVVYLKSNGARGRFPFCGLVLEIHDDHIICQTVGERHNHWPPRGEVVRATFPKALNEVQRELLCRFRIDMMMAQL